MMSYRSQQFIFILFFMVSFLLLPTVIQAEPEQVIIDEADLFSESEIDSLQALADKYGEKRDTSYYIITLDDPGSGDVEDYTDNFYHEEIQTDDEEVDLIILVIDMENRKVDIGGFGKMTEYLDDDRIEMIHDKIGSDLSDGNYYDAMETHLKLSYKYSGFKPNANPQNPLYNIFVQLLIAIVLGSAIVWGMVRQTGGEVTTSRRTYEDTNRSNVLRKRDRYIRRSVTKRRRPKQNKSSGGGRGRSSGGRMTSGGSMRSGGSRKF